MLVDLSTIGSIYIKSTNFLTKTILFYIEQSINMFNLIKTTTRKIFRHISAKSSKVIYTNNL